MAASFASFVTRFRAFLEVFAVECSVVIFPVFPVFLGKSRADTKNAGKLKIDVVRGCSEADAERAPFGMQN